MDYTPLVDQAMIYQYISVGNKNALLGAENNVYTWTYQGDNPANRLYNSWRQRDCHSSWTGCYFVQLGDMNNGGALSFLQYNNMAIEGNTIAIASIINNATQFLYAFTGGRKLMVI
ncbi:hypothetical protein ACAD17_003882 [Enterobacter ludwigii]